MSNSEYCEHESENSFDENEDNEIVMNFLKDWG